MRCIARLALAAVLSLSTAAHAGCTASDAWHGADKKLHAAGGFVIAAAVTGQTGNAWDGWGAAALVGFAKEAADSQRAGVHCSLQDFVATAAGGALGAAFTGWGLRLQRGGAAVSYAWALK